MSQKLDKLNKILEWVIRIIIVATLLQCILIGNWKNIFYLIVTFLLTFYDILIRKITKLNFPPSLRIAIILFIFGAQYGGTVQGLYAKWFWWDIMLHGLSGIIFFYVGKALWEQIEQKTSNVTHSPLLKKLFCVCFAMAIGVIWEIFEFTIDRYFGGNMQVTKGQIGQNAVMDTMTDLIIATLGAILSIGIEVGKQKIGGTKK